MSFIQSFAVQVQEPEIFNEFKVRAPDAFENFWSDSMPSKHCLFRSLDRRLQQVGMHNANNMQEMPGFVTENGPLLRTLPGPFPGPFPEASRRPPGLSPGSFPDVSQTASWTLPGCFPNDLPDRSRTLPSRPLRFSPRCPSGPPVSLRASRPDGQPAAQSTS